MMLRICFGWAAAKLKRSRAARFTLLQHFMGGSFTRISSSTLSQEGMEPWAKLLAEL